MRCPTRAVHYRDRADNAQDRRRRQVAWRRERDLRSLASTPQCWRQRVHALAVSQRPSARAACCDPAKFLRNIAASKGVDRLMNIRAAVWGEEHGTKEGIGFPTRASEPI